MRPTTRRLMAGWRKRAAALAALAGNKELFGVWFIRVYGMGTCTITNRNTLAALYEEYDAEVNGPDAPFSYYSDMEPLYIKVRGELFPNVAGREAAAKKDAEVQKMCDTAYRCGVSVADNANAAIMKMLVSEVPDLHPPRHQIVANHFPQSTTPYRFFRENQQ